MLFTYRNIWELFLILYMYILDGCRNKSSMTIVGKTKPKKCKQKSVGSYLMCECYSLYFGKRWRHRSISVSPFWAPLPKETHPLQQRKWRREWKWIQTTVVLKTVRLCARTSTVFGFSLVKMSSRLYPTYISGQVCRQVWGWSKLT